MSLRFGRLQRDRVEIGDTKSDYADLLITFTANDRRSSQAAFSNVSLKECCLSATRVLWAEGEQNMNNDRPVSYIIRFGVEVFVCQTFNLIL